MRRISPPASRIGVREGVCREPQLPAYLQEYKQIFSFQVLTLQDSAINLFEREIENLRYMKYTYGILLQQKELLCNLNSIQ